MRKFLLLFSMLIAAVTAFAQDPVKSCVPYVNSTDDANVTKTNVYTGSVTVTMSETETYTAKRFSTNNLGWTTNPMRCGNKNGTTGGTPEIYNNQAIAAKVNKIEVDVTRMKAGTNDKLGSNGMKLKVANNSSFTNATEYSFDLTSMPTAANGTGTLSITIPEPIVNGYYDVTFDCTSAATNNGWLAVDAVRYYGEAEEDAVEAPTITMGDNNTVSISAPEGDIYYTTNGDEPTTASTPYAAPFTITGTTTVKAIAVVGGKSSPVTSKTVKPNVVNSISDFITIAPSEPTKINTPLTAIYQNGRNLYLTDNKGGYLLAYNQSDIEGIAGQYVNGDVVAYAKGTYKSQNGLPELILTEVLGEKSQGEEVEPEELAFEEIGSDMKNKYVVVYGVNIGEATANNTYTANDGTMDYTIYNTFYNANNYTPVEVPSGDGFTVYGFVSCYNTTMQLTPIRFEGGEEKGKVETPTFNPVSGKTLNIGDEIAISCATAGATIYYTTDGTEPADDSEIYTEPLIYTGGNITVKAYAVKAGMFDSEIASASYTEYVEGQAKVTFDFSYSNNNAAELAAREIEPINADSEDQTKGELAGVTFINGPVAVDFKKGDNATSPRWWIGGASAYQLRTYGNASTSNEIVVRAAQNDFKIVSVKLLQGDATDANFKKCTFNVTVGAPTPETNVEVESRAADENGWDAETYTWTEGETNVNYITFRPTQNAQWGGLEVVYQEAPGMLAGIDSVSADTTIDPNAPVVIYNLQGVRVNDTNLAPGIYIMRQGSKAQKVLVR